MNDKEHTPTENRDENTTKVAKLLPRYNNGTLLKAVIAVLAIIVLSLLLYAFNLHQQLVERGRVISAMEKHINRLSEEITEKEEMITLLATENLNLIPLTGMEMASESYGNLFWNSEQSNLLLFVSNLPIAPQDSTYQLWTLNTDRADTVGSFSITSARNSQFIRFDRLQEFEPDNTDFGITLEPRDGSDQPTGDMYLFSSAN